MGCPLLMRLRARSGVAGAFLWACSTRPPLPAKALELNAQGAEAIALGDLSTAEARLSVALEYSPRFVEAWVNLGYVELRRGNFDQARRDFLHARDINDNIPAPHHALGVLADREGRGSEAELHYRAALRVDPGFAPARANLGRRLFERGQYENAREQFERLIEVEPTELDGWLGRAEALIQLGREGEADEVVARARARFGDVAPLRLLLARRQLRRGEYREAEALLAPLAGDATFWGSPDAGGAWLDRTYACAAWSWIAIARAGRSDAPGAEQAARAAAAIDRSDPLVRYAAQVARASRLTSGK